MKNKYPKYEKIKDYVIKGIKSRNFTDAVPSENQLAEKFGVSRMTARKAIDAVGGMDWWSVLPARAPL